MPVNRLARRQSLNRGRVGAALRGSKQFKRLMKGVPEAVRGQLAVVLEKGGRAMRSVIRARAPKRTGFGATGIDYKVYPRTLRMRVGLIGTRASLRDRFYMRIQDLGRSAQTVTVSRRKVGVNTGLRRGRKKNEEIAAVYQLRVRGSAPKRFITGSYGDMRRQVGSLLRGIWDRAIGSIAAGDGDE